jgi:hypothetical protein
MWFALAGLLCAGPAQAFSQSFNQASTLDARPNDGGGRNASSGQVSGPAELAIARDSSSNLPGHIEAFVRADYGSLKARLQTSGSITDHDATARTNEWFTVTDPAVAPGTIGTMHLGYALSGDATVHDANGIGVAGERVFADLIVFRGQSATQLGTELGRLSLRLVNGGAVGPPGTANRLAVQTDFEYGVPFNITSALTVRVRSDAIFNFLPSGQLVKLGGEIELLEADFANSAILDAVFIPQGATLSAGSTFDYAPVLRFGTPVPLPPAITLFATAVVGLCKRARGA